MSAMSQAAQIRDFNRFYTQTIGVLTDHYLGQRRPLAEARVLFEIGTEGSDVRDIRARLRLDSGYMSRLLRGLESAGLVETQPSPDDSRVRLARLTDLGLSELDELNARATTVAAELLEPLNTSMQTELLEAMAVIKRHLRLATVELCVIDPGAPDARESLACYAAELAVRFPEGYRPEALLSATEAREPLGVFVVARESGRVVGCGVLRTLSDRPAEIRHLWVHAAARGIGLGRQLVTELERQALKRGLTMIRLDTHRVLTEAINLYRSAGYAQVAAYDDNPHAHLWFEKSLLGEHLQ